MTGEAEKAAAAPEATNAAHCRAIVREGDRDRYLATLLTPSRYQDALFALYAFNLEIARVRDVVSQPLLGEMRYQWWRDALAPEGEGAARANPIAAALLDAIARYRLPRKACLDLIEARVFDLYDDPMPSLKELEAYCGATSSVLMRLASFVLANGEDPGGAEAAGHAGMAYAVTGLSRAFPWHAARGQLFMPLDLLRAHGVDREHIVSRRDSPGLRAALAEIRAIARGHLAETRRLMRGAAPPTVAALLPVALVEPLLDRLERDARDPFAPTAEPPQWRKQWRLWRAARAGR